MTRLRTPQEAEPDASAASLAGQDGTAGPGGQESTAGPGGQESIADLGGQEGTADLGGQEGTADFAGQDGTAEASTPGPAGVGLGAVGWLRWGWRQLTSMRTALILLFLLAAGSIPGSLLPQVGTNPAAVSQYYSSHPLLARIFGDLSLFNVFGAPWFAAVYILLFTSLVGCVLPRTLHLVGSARQPPPRAPSNLSRLPFAVSYATALAPEAALAAAGKALSARRFRLRTAPGWVAAEKGFLR